VLGDLLEVDARAMQDDTLYRCHDLLLPLKEEFFGQRGSLSSTVTPHSKCVLARSNRRGDCVQVVIALVVTTEGLPLAYEMFPGNTADETTLGEMLAIIRNAGHGGSSVWYAWREAIPSECDVSDQRRDNDPRRPSDSHHQASPDRGAGAKWTRTLTRSMRLTVGHRFRRSGC
jgi:hypothetical protein